MVHRFGDEHLVLQTSNADATNTKRKTLAKCYRQLIYELDIKIPMVDSTKCIVKVANRANLNKKTKGCRHYVSS